MTSQPLTAALWMIGAICSFTLMAVAGREVSFELDTFEIMLFRSVVGFAIVIVLARYAGTLGQVSKTRWPLHLMRNIAHFTGQNLWFYAVAVLPLAQVFALEFTSPIWVLLLSPLILGERITRYGVIGAVLGFIGVLIVTRPWLEPLSPPLVAAASAAVAFAFTAIFTRRLTRTDSITCIMVYLTGLQAVFGLICAGYDGDIAIPSGQSLPWLIGIAIAGLTAHFCLTKALTVAPASIVMPLDFVRLPVIAVVGMLFYQERFDVLVFVGAALIFAGNWVNIRHTARQVEAKR